MDIAVTSNFIYLHKLVGFFTCHVTQCTYRLCTGTKHTNKSRMCVAKIVSILELFDEMNCQMQVYQLHKLKRFVSKVYLFQRIRFQIHFFPHFGQSFVIKKTCNFFFVRDFYLFSDFFYSRVFNKESFFEAKLIIHKISTGNQVCIRNILHLFITPVLFPESIFLFFPPPDVLSAWRYSVFTFNALFSCIFALLLAITLKSQSLRFGSFVRVLSHFHFSQKANNIFLPDHHRNHKKVCASTI